jgi:hypothetical protein
MNAADHTTHVIDEGPYIGWKLVPPETPLDSLGIEARIAAARCPECGDMVGPCLDARPDPDPFVQCRNNCYCWSGHLSKCTVPRHDTEPEYEDWPRDGDYYTGLDKRLHHWIDLPTLGLIAFVMQDGTLNDLPWRRLVGAGVRDGEETVLCVAARMRKGGKDA